MANYPFRTQADVDEYLAEHRRKMGRTGPPPVCDALSAYEEQADEGPESKLADKIMGYCKERGYPCQCFRRSRKAIGFLVPGWWD